MENIETEKAKEYTGPVQCGHCGTKTVMELAAHFRKTYESYDERGNYWEDTVKWELLFCPVCSKVNLIKREWTAGQWDLHGESEEPEDYKTVHPTYGKPILGLPPNVDKEYQSACRVRNVDSNLFGVAIGRVIDEICLNRGTAGRTLNDRIESLAQMGEIPEKLSDMAHSLRKLRNIGAHADLGNLTDDEVPVLDDLCRAILEYVYAAPELIKQVELRLEELKNNTKKLKEEKIEADDDIPDIPF